MSENAERGRRRRAVLALVALLLFLLGSVAGDWLAGTVGDARTAAGTVDVQAGAETGVDLRDPGFPAAQASAPEQYGSNRAGRLATTSPAERSTVSGAIASATDGAASRPGRAGGSAAARDAGRASGGGAASVEPGPSAGYLRGGLATRTPPAVPRREADEDCGAPSPGAPNWPGEVLFRPAGSFEEGALAGFAAFVGGELQPRSSGCILARGLPAGVSEREWAAFLKSEGLARAAYPNFLCWPAWVPNDPQLGAQWHVDKIGLKNAWDVSRGDAALVIAVCDTGIDTDHPDLAAKIVAGYNSVDGGTDVEAINGHGTMVAGMAAAVTNNGVQLAGAAPTCQIMPVKISNLSGGVATLADMTDGIAWAAAHGAHVINCSYNDVPVKSFYDAMDDVGADCDLAGAVLVMAAGNNSADMGPDQPWDHVLWVGSTNTSDALSSFSQYGDALDLVAPGENVLLSALGGSTSTSSGTSFASPCVAGVLGLMYSASGFVLTPAEYRAALYATCKDLGAAGKDDTFGWGRVDAFAAVIAVGAPSAVISATPSSGKAPLTVAFSGSSSMEGHKVLTYLWDFGDGQVGAGKNVSHTYTGVGIYTAALMVTDAGGLSGTDTVDIAVDYAGMPGKMYMWRGQRVDYVFVPVGGSGAVTVTLSAGALPPGLDLTDGRLTGNPTTLGTWNITLDVDDGIHPVTSQTVAILVRRAGFGRFRGDLWR